MCNFLEKKVSAHDVFIGISVLTTDLFEILLKYYLKRQKKIRKHYIM